MPPRFPAAIWLFWGTPLTRFMEGPASLTRSWATGPYPHRNSSRCLLRSSPRQLRLDCNFHSLVRGVWAGTTGDRSSNVSSSHPISIAVIGWYFVDGTQSAAIKRRSRCGSVRGCPVLSSHFSPTPAPQVGQRIAWTCLRVGLLVFTVRMMRQAAEKEWSILHESSE